MSKTREKVKLDLSLNDKDKNMLDMKKKMLEEDLASLPPIKENDINIATSYIFDSDDKVEVGVFFRNGLKSTVNFDIVQLNLLDEDNNVICTQSFKLNNLCDIPSLSARPYELYFDKKYFSMDKPINSNWKVSFTHNINITASVKVDYENFPNTIDLETKLLFENYLNSLPLVKKNEVDFNVHSVTLSENNQFNILILIRNGFTKSAVIENMPISIYDGDKKLIYSAMSNFTDLIVGAEKAKLVTLAVDCKESNLSTFNLQNLTAELKNYVLK